MSKVDAAASGRDDAGPDRATRFRRRFTRWATRVRSHLVARRVVAGIVVGLVLGCAGTAAAWKLRQDTLRPWMAALGLAGAAVGAVVAQRRRWSDGYVALYLDRKLDSDESISTAIDLQDGNGHGDDAVRAAVIEHAERALQSRPPKGTWPRVWRTWHLVGPAAAGVIVWLSLVALPALPPPPPPPPGSDIVALSDVQGLEEVIRLSDLDTRDEDQRRRLKELSDRAKRLRSELRQGMPRREAQSEIAKLRDAIASERMRLGTGEQRQGLESALGKLARNPQLDRARQALGDRDLTRFDEEMRKLANTLEERDREKAKQTLEEAAEAARKQGAKDVAGALEEQKRLLDERGKRATHLRELAKAFGEGLSDEAKEALENFNQSGKSADSQKLAEQLEKALEGLSDQERKQLAENLKRQASQLDPDSEVFPLTKEQLEQMQKQLETPEGQKQLQEQLKRMAKDPGKQSDGSKRQQQLGEAQKRLGLMPMPSQQQGGGQCQGGGDKPGSKPGSKPGQPGKAGSSNGKQQDGKPGISRGGGPGNHDGKTAPVETDPLRAKAHAPVNPGAPMPGLVMGRTPGRPGETANKAGTGQLGVVGPDEVGAVERSEVPEEYREQVGRYFQP